jgi:hypothetical protein
MLEKSAGIITRFGLILCLAAFTSISLFCATQSMRLAPPMQPVPETYFGMHIHGIDFPMRTTNRLTPWPDVPFGTWRLHDAYVRWVDLEPRKNEFNFTHLDKYVATAQQKHVKVLLPLYASPQWASARPTEESRTGTPGTAAEPADMEDWRNFVRTVATRYKGRIEAYEVWNEPNLTMYWTGSVKQLVDMSREAFRIIKSVDPDALVVLPACTSGNGPQFLDDFLKQGGGQYGDVIGYHFYVSGAPEAIIDMASRVKDILRANHVDKPVWNTESGWHDPSPFPSDELGAAYVSRALILAWAAGVSRFYWYSWDGHGWVSLEMVEVVDDVTKKPAAKAYATTEQWLLGAAVRSCDSAATSEWTCELERNGKRQWVVWNTKGPATFVVPAEWHAAHDTLLLGSKEKLKNTTVQIGLIPILLEP